MNQLLILIIPSCLILGPVQYIDPTDYYPHFIMNQSPIYGVKPARWLRQKTGAALLYSHDKCHIHTISI